MIGTLSRRPAQSFSKPAIDNGRQIEDRTDRLVLKAENVQADALGLLYEQYVDRIYRYVYFMVGSVRQTEKLTHEAFLQASEVLSGNRGLNGPFLARVVRIAHSLVWNTVRNEDANPSVTNTTRQPAGVSGMERAMQCLPPEHREALSLRFAAGLSVGEVAAVMGKSEGAVKRLQFQAIAKLTEENGTPDG